MRRLLPALLLAVLLLPQPLHAQEAAPDPDALARGMVRMLDDVRQATGENKPDLPAMEAVPFEEAKRVVGIGQISGLASWCGVEWKDAHFLPFMVRERAKETWSKEQLAYLAVLHGMTQGVVEKTFREKEGTCSAERHERAKQAVQSGEFR